MKKEAIKDYVILNGKIIKTEEIEIFEKVEKPPIYEVIRTIDGVPLFLEDHLERMFESANIIGYRIDKDIYEIKNDIKKLILKNNIDKLNIKLLSTDIEGIGKVFLVYNIESFYPPEEYYKDGIHTTIFHHERNNPNAKVLFTSFKENVTKKLEENKAFEALLVNKSGYIPEGSRSNIFFVKGDKVYTAKGTDVLIGITRKHIFNICNKLNIKIVEESIHIDDIRKIDGAFMSGTSVNVLPISSIDDIKIDSINNKIIREIKNTYVTEMNNYISNNKKQWK
ncbi:aminotransferase class IV [Tissierella pigra]|uniref:Aminotransferase class IV n=1 Tax=Tissierella pigra TaxID=2607614 RepID=A0A6N7XHF1_9FIRM|nr:aminotransferase class IV [Tissierella pigra]MBU5425803.1 aminotransferase class IV [Tissierella pigra]MSU01459.1 aminotransferase class IV [Tissierella pigra]